MKKKTFYIDFNGYCEIEADTPEQAVNEFWRLIQEELPLPQNVYHLEYFEEKVN